MAQHIIKHLLLSTLLLNSAFARGETKSEPSPSTIGSEAVLRTEGPLVDMRLNPDKTLMAFVDQRGQSLRIMDLNTQDVYELTPHRVGSAYFWSPDGKRLASRPPIRERRSCYVRRAKRCE
ncbi:MAG: hypothetical protein EOP10_33405, partial [Proteobacteria bacterium]